MIKYQHALYNMQLLAEMIWGLLPSEELAEMTSIKDGEGAKHNTDCCHNNILPWTQSAICYDISATHSWSLFPGTKNESEMSGLYINTVI